MERRKLYAVAFRGNKWIRSWRLFSVRLEIKLEELSFGFRTIFKITINYFYVPALDLSFVHSNIL